MVTQGPQAIGEIRTEARDRAMHVSFNLRGGSNIHRAHRARPPIQQVRVRIPGETFTADRNGLMISISNGAVAPYLKRQQPP